jgi:hypothetical protein
LQHRQQFTRQAISPAPNQAENQNRHKDQVKPIDRQPARERRRRICRNSNHEMEIKVSQPKREQKTSADQLNHKQEFELSVLILMELQKF